jgi:hypothetical protein
MKRRLFNLAAAVSLGMMLAVVALWVRSYWAADYFKEVGAAFASCDVRICLVRTISALSA